MQRPFTEVDSTNKVIFNYVRERGINAYNNSLPFEEVAVTDARPISLRRYLKNSKKISLNKPTYGKQFLYKQSEPKGEIIIHYIEKLQQLQDKIERIESQQNTKSGRFSKVGSKAY